MLYWKIDCLIYCFPSTFLPPPQHQNLFCKSTSLLKLPVCPTFPVLPLAFGNNNRFLHLHRFRGSASRYLHTSVHRRDGDECPLKSYTRACFTCLSSCWASSVQKWRLSFWYTEIVNLEEVETRLLRNPSLDHNSTGGRLTLQLSF